MPNRPRLFRRLAWYRRRIDSLEQQAVVDELTGLRTQRALWRELNRRGPLCSPSHPLAVLMLDFDRLKEINDHYGHLVGDAVLRRAAGVLRSAAGSPRFAFRYGGEEFVVLAEAGEEEAVDLAERVRADIARENGSLPAVTASCGIAAFDAPVEPWVALDVVDAALLRAKREGPNGMMVARGADSAANGFHLNDREQEPAQRAAIALAVATLEARDTNTALHSDDVVTLCEAVGRRLDLDDLALQHLRAGGQLHDVGKVAVPSSILNKPSALTPEEWEIIREHTVIGERILRSVPEMADVATIVRHSHEHWDGSGYPDGLAGDRIPLASRVILCADAFHAIRSDRPYRRGRSAGDAIAEIKACAGTQFDPAVVDAFVEVAKDTRAGRATGRMGTRSNKRLIILLTTLVVGGGSAVAAIPELRDALKSVFGSSTPPSHASPDVVDTQGFDFGPLGDLLLLKPAAQRERRADGQHVQRRGASGSHAARPERRAQRNHRGGAFIPRGTPAPGNGPTDTTTTTTGGGGGEASPAPDTEAATPVGDSHGKGNGRALGRDVPVPRRPDESPSDHPGGRTDPPALGHDGPAPHSNGKP